MRTLITFGFLFLFLSQCQAELYECNGTWTNQPCKAGEGHPVDNPRISRLSEGGHTEKPEAGAKDKIMAEIKRAEALELQATEKEKEKVETSEDKDTHKDFMISAMKNMNKACKKYFSLGEIKSFEKYCNGSDTTVDKCNSRWSAMHSEMLGHASTESCRKAIFEASNKYGEL